MTEISEETAGSEGREALGHPGETRVRRPQEAPLTATGRNGRLKSTSTKGSVLPSRRPAGVRLRTGAPRTQNQRLSGTALGYLFGWMEPAVVTEGPGRENPEIKADAWSERSDRRARVVCVP